MRQESGTEAQRLAYDTTSAHPAGALPVLSTWEVTSGSGQGNKYTWGGTAWVQTHSGGAALVSTDGVPKAPIAPTILTNGGTTSVIGTVVIVDASAAVGSQHIQVSGDVEADVYQELVGFEFAEADDIRAVLIGLITAPQATPEAQRLAFTLNGDVVADATILFAEADNCLFLPINVIARIPSPSAAITRVGCIAKTSGLTKTANSVLELMCIGLKEVP